LRDGFLAPVRLETLARELDVHPSHLARSFRESHGCTVGEYVRQLRVARAAELLKSTSASILEIALATGFADQAHLSTVFRKWMGTSPGRYRKLLHGECKNPKTAQDS
jgi:AraC family transcriptional regulator